MSEVEGPEGPHYDDSWWIGAKSEVSLTQMVYYKNRL